MKQKPRRIDRKSRRIPLKVISFYTTKDGSSYGDEARILRDSLERVGMEYEIVELPDLGGWYAATAYKADFIYEQRLKEKGPLLWVDADAVVHQNCTPFFEELGARGVDFAAHWFAGPPKGFDFSKNCACLRGLVCSKPHRFLSGTTFWGTSERTIRLARAWAAMNQTFRENGIEAGGGQKNLWFLVTCMEKMGLKVTRLPGRFTYVFDKPEGYPKNEPRVIEHTIASRDHRGKRNQSKGRAERIQQLRKGKG